MKHVFALLWLMSFALKIQAAAVIDLNSHEAQMPVYFKFFGNLATSGDVYASVYAAPHIGGVWYPLATYGSTDKVFKVDENGYFDGGTAVIPDVEDFSQITFYVVAWKGNDNFEMAATMGKSPAWIQSVGYWDPNSGTPISGPALMLPQSIVMEEIPEPAPVALLMLGAGIGWLTKNRHRREPVAQWSSNKR